MKKNIKNTLFAIAAFAMVAITTGCGSKGMVVAVSKLPDSLNPILEQNVSGLNANELIFDGLTNFEVDPQSGRLYTELALAEDIYQDPTDKKTYTVTLRDVNWHDDTPVTADDVVYSYNAYTLEENKSPKRDYINSFISKVEAVDDKTVTIVFKNPMPEFRAYPVLTFKIIPSRYEGHNMDVNMREGETERKFATAPVGTGPFKFNNWKIGKQITFSANGLYFRTTPRAATLTLKQVIDPIVRMNELRKGRINLILETNPMDRANVKKISGIEVNSYMPYAFYSVEINSKLFPKAEGRQAMAMAMERENLIPGITDEEEGVVLNYGPYPSNLFQVNIPEYINEPLPNLLPYDLGKAKRLAKSGDLSGQNAILIYPDSMGDFGKQMADGVAKQLEAIGLNVEVKKTGDQVFNRMVYKEQSYELALIYHDGFDNVYSSLSSMYTSKGSENITGTSDKKLNNLFDAVDKEVETNNWADLVMKINQRSAELSPSIFLCSLQKDVYCRGITNVYIATDNPFLSVEEWKFGSTR